MAKMKYLIVIVLSVLTVLLVFVFLPQPSTSSYYPEGLVIEDVETGLLISVSNKNTALFRSIIQMIKK